MKLKKTCRYYKNNLSAIPRVSNGKQSSKVNLKYFEIVACYDWSKVNVGMNVCSWLVAGALDPFRPNKWAPAKASLS